MSNLSTPSRRAFLKLVAIGAIAPATAAGCGGSELLRDVRFTNFNAAREQIRALASKPELSQSASWSLAKTLVHCAQSIEYTLTGFPDVYSPVFHNTLGKAARHLFQWQGYMRHDLAEPIPGAEAIDETVSLQEAVVRVEYAMDHFRLHSGPFMPHFAYGKLNKAEHEILQAMHIANHLSAFA